MRRLAPLLPILAALVAAAPSASASELVGRTSTGGVRLEVAAGPRGSSVARITYVERSTGRRTSVCVTPIGTQLRVRKTYACDTAAKFRDAGATGTWACARRIAPGSSALPPPATAIAGFGGRTRTCYRGGRTWHLQLWQRGGVSDNGGSFARAWWEVHVSTWTRRVLAPSFRTQVNPLGPASPGPTVALASGATAPFDGFPTLQGYTRWSRNAPGGSTGYRQALHYPILWGAVTYGRLAVWGRARTGGFPTDRYGRNVYLDTWSSDYGRGWRRLMGVLTQQPTGSFCFEAGPKRGSNGRTGISTAQRYRMTVIGPGTTPVVRIVVRGPRFPFGAPDYDPVADQWGYRFSAEQGQALRWQMNLLGPAYLRPATGVQTDCGKQLRLLAPRISGVVAQSATLLRAYGESLQGSTVAIDGVPAASTRFVNTKDEDYLEIVPASPLAGGTVEATTIWGTATGSF